MSIKMIAFDLDGTLLNEVQRISQKSLNEIRRAKERGIKISVATGRSFSASKFYANQINADYIVCCNGAIIYDAEKNDVIYKKPMPQNTAHEIILEMYNYSDALKIQWDSFGTYYSNNLLPFEQDYINEFQKEYPNETFNLMLLERIENKLDFLKDDEIYQIFTFSMTEDNEGYFNVLKSLKKYDDISYVDFQENYTDITHQDVSKGDALEYLFRINNFKPEELMAFGDNHNDETMIRYAGQSVAMNNAHSLIKGMAKYVTGSNCEEGIADFMQKYFE
jgi:Cof subfamily protein (haloacid dehalogenase superfamily)